MFELCLEAVKENGNTLEFVKDQTDEICLEALCQDHRYSRLIKDLSSEMKQIRQLCDTQGQESYRQVRQQLANGTIRPYHSIYHVLERAYLR